MTRMLPSEAPNAAIVRDIDAASNLVGEAAAKQSYLRKGGSLTVVPKSKLPKTSPACRPCRVARAVDGEVNSQMIAVGEFTSDDAAEGVVAV